MKKGPRSGGRQKTFQESGPVGGLGGDVMVRGGLDPAREDDADE